MLEAFERILNALSPLLIAMMTAFSAMVVARISSLQKDVQANKKQTAQVHADLKTNHGSKNIGDAIDILRTKVDEGFERQDKKISEVATRLESQDLMTERRVATLEKVVDTALSVSVHAQRAVTESISIISNHKGDES